MSVYEEIYLQLDNIQSLYGEGEEMLSLAYTREEVTSNLNCLGSYNPRISRDVKDLFYRCIGHMCVIILKEEDNEVKFQGEEYFKELSHLLTKLP